MRQWLIIARKTKGLTQKEISEMIGISQSSYCMYERGESTPRPRNAKKLAKILGISPMVFFTDPPCDKQ